MIWRDAGHLVKSGQSRPKWDRWQVGLCVLSILLYEPYANESSQICPFPAVRAQFDSDHHKNRRLSSHSYSHESVIFWVFFGLIFVNGRRVCVFFS